MLRAILSTLAVVVFAGPAAAQDDGRVEAAVEKWLASELSSQELLDETVKIVLDAQQAGLPHIGRLLAADSTDRDRERGIRALATHVSLGFLQRETSGPVIYAGQYRPLEPLQPFVGELFFSWLIDTPTWYPESHRVQLIPALRDLQPTLPAADKLEGVLEIVENEAIEPEDLRSAIACMLWQWGKKQYAQPRLDKLVGESAEGEAEDRVRAMLRLADLHYRLRDYRSAAATHRALQSLAKNAEVALKPVEWYWAACVHALAGDAERGIAALERAVELQASDDVDSSHKVEREVWKIDPEIDALRRDPRFPSLLERALKHSPEKTGRR